MKVAKGLKNIFERTININGADVSISGSSNVSVSEVPRLRTLPKTESLAAMQENSGRQLANGAGLQDTDEGAAPSSTGEEEVGLEYLEW